MASTEKTEAEPFLRTFRLQVEDHPAYEEMTEEEKAPVNLQVQAQVDLVVHGTERPDGPPATLMVFGFHFDESDHNRLFKTARITIKFTDRRSWTGTGPVVGALWPEGKSSLDKDGNVYTRHSRSQEMEVDRYATMSLTSISGDDGSVLVVLRIYGPITVVLDYRFALLLRRPGMESKSDDELFEASFSNICVIEFPPNRINRHRTPFRIDSDNNRMDFQPGQNYIRRSSSSEVLGGSIIKKFIDTDNLSAVKLDDLVGDAVKSMLATYEVRTKRPVLSPEITSWLQSKELLDPAMENRRALSMAVFRDRDFTWTQESSSTEPAAFISDDDHPRVDIPVHLYSAETYEFLGYTRDVAKNLWKSVDKKPDSPYDFLDAAKIYMRNTASSQSGDTQVDLRTHIDRIGISEELRDAVLLPQFRDIRQTESCEFWLENAMDIRWAELQALNDNLRKVQERSVGNNDATPESDSAMSPTDTPSSPQGSTTVTTPTPSLPSQQPGASTVDDKDFKSVSKTNGADVETIDMWRGGVEARLEGCIGDSDKALAVGAICSRPGDFSGLLAVPYFTPQRETAVLYAAFNQQLTKLKPHPYLLHVVVPKRWIMGLRHRCFWNTPRICYWADPHKCQHLEIPGLPWKQLVYRCRIGRFTEPALEHKSLLIGHTAKNHHEEFHGVNPKKSIEDRDVLQVHGLNAIQFAFTSEKTMKELELQAIKVELSRVHKEAGDDAENEDDKVAKTQMDNVYYLNEEGEKDFPARPGSDRSNTSEVSEFAGQKDPESWGRLYAFYMRVTRECCHCKVEGRYGFLSRYVDGNEGIVASVMAGGLLTAWYVLRQRK